MINRRDLLASAQRGLLGNVAPSVVGVAVDNPEPGVLTMTGFVDPITTEEERESLNVALTEMVADLPKLRTSNLEVIEVPDGRIPRKPERLWVFVRYGA